MREPTYTRYRVYPPNALYPTGQPRARSFRHLRAAQEFAASAFVLQGINPTAPVQVVIGSGSDFEVVGEYGHYGWRYADGSTL